MASVEDKKLRILCVGIVIHDTICVCEKYPLEDSEQTVVDIKERVGGNASNNCTILSMLGANAEFMGTITKGTEFSRFHFDHMDERKIVYSHCPEKKNGVYPVSVIIVNNEHGTRTILHHRTDWPEVSFEDFKKINLEEYSWIHFEGRRTNTEQIKKKVQWIEEWNNKRDSKSRRIKTSTELEKPFESVAELLPCTDLVFIGKVFANWRGCSNMEETIEKLSPKTKPGGIVVVPWGSRGAVAYSKESGIVRSPSFPPEKVIDSIGAGDTFCAAVIFSLVSGKDLQKSIEYGCKIAGAKVGMFGYDGVREFNESLKN